MIPRPQVATGATPGADSLTSILRARRISALRGRKDAQPTATAQHRLAHRRERRYCGSPIYRGPLEPNPLTQRPDDREVREMLAGLRAEHRDLDEQIVKLETEHSGDQVTIKRLKKQKLLLKDRISALEDQMTPDIIA
jgi:hypothetical protein